MELTKLIEQQMLSMMTAPRRTRRKVNKNRAFNRAKRYMTGMGKQSRYSLMDEKERTLFIYVYKTNLGIFNK